MPLFNIPSRPGKDADMQLARKSSARLKVATPTVKGGSSILEKISAIVATVEKNLGKFKDDYIIIQDEETLISYINKCIINNVISIDTETTGLDPMLDDIVGICIYTPNEKGAYIPVNHISYITGIKVENQLPVDILCREFSRLKGIDTIMFNANFDVRFMKHKIGVDLVCTWDCYLASRLLNENEPKNGLKALHQKYVLDGEGDAFSFGELFSGISFDRVPINTGYLYAAHDAVITYELYEYQKPFLTIDGEECVKRGLNDVAWVFHNIEMPCVQVVTEMEDSGIEFDFEYNSMLKEKYHKLLEDKKVEFYKLCDMYSSEIEEYRLLNRDCKLDTPINIGSPTQIAILLYDIMKVEPIIDKKTKKESRGTGEAILTELDNPIGNAVLSYREFDKLVNTYIDKLPECVNPNTGRIHCKFNQMGADTGRMSSQDPNLQNIPSHNKDIRKMFKASSGEELILEVDNHFEVDKWCEVKSQRGWISACNVIVGDMLEVDDATMITVTKIEPVDKNHILLYY